MPPVLRSNSAQNSPARGSSERSIDSTPSATPRKAPRCSKCGRPKAGHPRSGCPYTNLPVSENARKAQPLVKQLSNALESLTITTITNEMRLEDRGEDMKVGIQERRALERNDSIVSLGSSATEVAAILLQTGEESNPGDKSTEAPRVVHWQDFLNNRPSRIMPGTLIPLSPDNSFTSSSTAPPMKEEVMSEPEAENAPTDLEDALSYASFASTEPNALTRTMSQDERDAFVAKLSEDASTSIYVVPRENLDFLVNRAESLNFSTHFGLQEDEDDPQALLILARNRQSVDDLLDRIYNADKKACHKSFSSPGSRRSSTLKTAVGAAVFSAAATFGVLAFT
ncbi:hypothetical protein CPB84DRAFT_1759002 [Gymnopilus junonius]|uniref:Uncharacterized protein n=1 Tax=Gymnopilus junonius TaxID=109634 RepID=A0A9P5P586_GYMJU|nr:hypothetical protein CPB84DRAFT_1759002 [Gymnopilus junonius]